MSTTTITRPAVTSKVTMTEFTNHSGKSVWATRSNAAVVNGFGMMDSGLATASASVLKDVDSCTTNG